MSQILIAGATGLVGQALIRQLGTEHQLTLLCRQPGEAAPNRHWLPVDFERLNEVALPGPVDMAFCCLGTTRKDAGSDEAFRRVDHDVSIHRNSIDTGKMRRSSLDPTFLLA